MNLPRIRDEMNLPRFRDEVNLPRFRDDQNMPYLKLLYLVLEVNKICLLLEELIMSRIRDELSIHFLHGIQCFTIM